MVVKRPALKRLAFHQAPQPAQRQRDARPAVTLSFGGVFPCVCCCRVALKWALPHFVWCSDSILALNNTRTVAAILSPLEGLLAVDRAVSLPDTTPPPGLAHQTRLRCTGPNASSFSR